MPRYALFPSLMRRMAWLCLFLASALPGHSQQRENGPALVPASAEVIAEWNFDNTSKQSIVNASVNSADYLPDIGYGTLFLEGGATLFQFSSGGQMIVFATGVSGQAIIAKDWHDGLYSKYWMIRTSTLGYENITINSAQRSSPTGPKNIIVEYSLDANIWHFVPGTSLVLLPDNFPSGTITGISLPAECNNASDVYLRWIITSNLCSRAGTGSYPVDEQIATGGTNRIDNIIIRGTPIPLAVAGTVASNQTVCAGETPTALTLSGYTGDLIQWQSSPNGSTGWVNIGGANDATLSGAQMGALTETRYYRAAVSLGGGDPEYSNSVAITVNPLMPVSVSISTPETEVCEGTQLTFTASPVNGGSASYQWFVNGSLQANNQETFSYVPVNGDEVYVVLASNLDCATNNPATSNTIAMVVIPKLPVSVTTEASENNVCEGTQVTFSATPVSEGANPDYQWFVNGDPAGTNQAFFSYQPYNGDRVHVVLTSSLDCVANQTAVSDEVVMVVYANAPANILPLGPYCQGETPDALPAVSEDNVPGTWNPPVIDTSQHGTFPYTFTPEDGKCSEARTIDITIEPLVIPVFETTFCQGPGTYTLPGESINGIYGYWPQSQISLLEAGDYPRFFFTYNNQCAPPSVYYEISVVESFIPEFNIPTSFCLGDTATALPLKSDNGITGTWSPPVISTASADTKTYRFTPGSAEACATTVEIDITVHEPPEINCPAFDAVCKGAPAIEFPGNGFYYHHGLLVTEFPPANDGIFPFEYMVVSDNQCVSRCWFDITVLPLPTAYAGEGPLKVNPDEFTTITGATAIGDGSADLAVLWIPEDLFIDPKVIEPVLKPITNQIIVTLQVAQDGCSHSDHLEIKVSDIPLSATPYAEKYEICQGETVQLYAGISGGVGDISYQWYYTYQGGAAEPFAIDENPEHTPEQNVFYSVVITDDNGDFYPEDGIDVAVVSRPSLDEYGDMFFCVNDDFSSLDKLVPDNDGQLIIEGEYQDDFQIVVNGVPKTYNITVIKKNYLECTSNKDFTITIRPNPIATAGTDPFEVNPGEEKPITGATFSGVGPSGVEVLWTPEDLFIDPTVIEPVLKPITAATTVTLTVTKNGCSHSDQLQIKVLDEQLIVNPLSLSVSPPGTGIVTGEGSYPAGETVTISASPVLVGWGFDYWSGNVAVDDPGAATTSLIMPANNASLTAHFKYVWFDISFEIIGYGFVASHPSPYQNFDDIPGPGGNISLPPNGSEYFRFVPDDGYLLLDVIIDGVSMGPIPHYTFSNVSGNHLVRVIFSGAQTFTLNYLAEDGGMITGNVSQTVDSGSAGSAVTAVPNTGYHFVQWSDGSTDNPRTDSNVTADLTVRAQFAINTYSLIYIALVNGSVSGNTSQTVSYGGTSTEVTAIPGTGYHFVQWSDGSTANPRIDANVTADLMVTAQFAINTYALTYNADVNGSVSGNTSQTVSHGGNGIAVTAAPNTGYHFVQWSDGSTANPRTDSNVTDKLTVTAQFAINTYQLTYVAEPGGDVTGEKEQQIQHGGSGNSVTAVPQPGYFFAGWSDNHPFPQRTDSVVTQNQTYTAWFTRNRYTLTYLAGPGGYIEGITQQQVYFGADGSMVTARPNPGYVFTGWSDGYSQAERTDTGITGNINMTATFSLQGFMLTFNVDMSYAGQYNEAVDEVFITGSMFDYATPGSRPAEQRLVVTGPKRLTNSVYLPPGRYYYKYFLNTGWYGEEWLGAPVRMAEIKDRNVLVFDYFGNTGDPTTVHLPEDQSFVVYPNPARFTLTIVSDTSEPLRYLRLLNMLGQPVYIADATDQTQVMIDVSQFIPGLYFVQVLTIRGWKTAKILISQ